MLVARRNCSLMSLLTTSAITQSCRRERFRSLFSLIDVAAPGAARFLAKRLILRDDAVSESKQREQKATSLVCGPDLELASTTVV